MRPRFSARPGYGPEGMVGRAVDIVEDHDLHSPVDAVN